MTQDFIDQQIPNIPTQHEDSDWRELTVIEGYEDKFLINQYGEVYTTVKKKLLNSFLNTDGYPMYVLCKNGKTKAATAHKLVALTFIPNPNNYPIINHKDENRQNPYYENLEWCTSLYNNLYSDNGKKAGLKTGRKTYAYNFNGELIGEYYSAKEAARSNNASKGTVANCVRYWNGDRKYNTYHVKKIIYTNTPKTSDEILQEIEKHKTSSPINIKNNYLSKPIAQIDVNTNEIIREFPSLQEVKRVLGFNLSSIGRAARKYDQGATSHGYKWKYI